MGIDARLRLAKVALSVDARSGRGGLTDFLEAVLPGGVDIVTVDDPTLPGERLAALVEEARAVAFPHRGLVAVADAVDVAARIEADLVQVRQRNADLAAVRHRLHRWAKVGLVVRDAAELEAALAHPSVGYLLLESDRGPSGSPGAGELVRTAVSLAPPGTPSSKPWFAASGADEDEVEELIGVGARRLAVGTAVTRADDPRAVARRLATRVRKAWDDDPAMERYALGAFGGGRESFGGFVQHQE